MIIKVKAVIALPEGTRFVTPSLSGHWRPATEGAIEMTYERSRLDPDGTYVGFKAVEPGDDFCLVIPDQVVTVRSGKAAKADTKTEPERVRIALVQQIAEIECDTQLAGFITRETASILDEYDQYVRGHRKLTCVYCGHEYPEGTPASMACPEASSSDRQNYPGICFCAGPCQGKSQELTDHIRACEKHPMRALEATIKEVATTLGALGPAGPGNVVTVAKWAVSHMGRLKLALAQIHPLKCVDVHQCVACEALGRTN